MLEKQLRECPELFPLFSITTPGDFRAPAGAAAVSLLRTWIIKKAGKYLVYKIYRFNW
jgi:hypothetical protein